MAISSISALRVQPSFTSKDIKKTKPASQKISNETIKKVATIGGGVLVTGLAAYTLVRHNKNKAIKEASEQFFGKPIDLTDKTVDCAIDGVVKNPTVKNVNHALDLVRTNDMQKTINEVESHLTEEFRNTRAADLAAAFGAAVEA